MGLCTGDYVLKVDADDEVVTPGDLLPTLELMEKHQNLDIVMSPYETMSTPNGASLAPEHTSLYTRLWRHSDAIRFAEVCHENIDHARQPDGSNWLIAHNGLVVCDWRDSTNPRAPHRNYKILLREYERLMEENELPSRHLLFYLGEEGIEPDPMFVITVLLPLIGSEERDLGLSLEDRIWSYLIEGRCWSKMEHVNLATSAFEQAVLLGSSRALLLLGMLRFKAKMDGWRADLENSLGVCERKMWPFGASRTEIETARSMLCPRASKD